MVGPAMQCLISLSLDRTFCASFFLSVFMQLPTREHLRKSLLKTLQQNLLKTSSMGWHVSATRHLFITIWADLLPCLNLLMSPLVTASCSKGGVLCSGVGPRERFTASIMWQSDMRRRRVRARWCRKRSIWCWWHYLWRCCCNITIYHPETGKRTVRGWDQRVGQIFIHFFIHLSYQKRLDKLSYRQLSSHWKMEASKLTK